MRYGMRVTAICYALLGLILCVWSLASWTYGGALPAALSATLRLAQFAVTLLAIWLSLRLDAAASSLRLNQIASNVTANCARRSVAERAAGNAPPYVHDARLQTQRISPSSA